MKTKRPTKETIICLTKVVSIIVICSYLICFFSGLNLLEELPLRFKSITSEFNQLNNKQNEFKLTKFTCENTTNFKAIKRIFFSIDGSFSKFSSSNDKLVVCKLSNKGLSNKSLEKICIDTIISRYNTVYFSLVFFLGAFLNNKSIIKIGCM